MENEILVQILSKLDSMDKELKDLRQGQEVLRDSVLRLELIEVPKIHLALDGLSTHKNTADNHEGRITLLEDKSIRHDAQIAALLSAQS